MASTILAYTGSCTAARCWSSRARAAGPKRPPLASPSARKRHNLIVLPQRCLTGHKWGSFGRPSGVFALPPVGFAGATLVVTHGVGCTVYEGVVDLREVH